MKKSALLASLLVTALGIGGLAGSIGIASAMTGKPGDNVRPARDRDQCFDPTFLRGFQTPGGNRLIIISDRNEAYELKLGGVCIGLDTSMAIGVRSRHGMSDVCGPFDADILYSDMGETRQCPVSSVRHLVGEEAAEYVHKPVKKNAEAASGASSSSTSKSNW